MQMPAFTPDNIINAIQRIKQMDPTMLKQPRDYQLLYEGDRFPPKEVLRYAALDLEGEMLEGHRGGAQTNDVLIKLGFTIVLLGEDNPIGIGHVERKSKKKT